MTIKTVGIIAIVIGCLFCLFMVAYFTTKNSIVSEDGSRIDLKPRFFAFRNPKTDSPDTKEEEKPA